MEVYYITLLNISGVLWFGCFLKWINYLKHWKINMDVILSCQFTTFTYYFFTHCSVWLLVVMTIEKCLAVSIPLRAKVFCTVKMAKIVSLYTIMIWAIQWNLEM